MPGLIGFCGASNSGKTTLLQGLIAELCQRGLKVGAIKHHGHAQPLYRPAGEQGKDSSRLAAAGAERVVLSHTGGLEITAGPESAAQGPRAIAQRFLADLDLVLVEGYKRAPIDKVEVLASDGKPMLPAGEVLARALPGGQGADPQGVRLLDSNDYKGLADFVLKHAGQAEVPSVSLRLDGKPAQMNNFVQRLLAATVRGLVSSLKGGPEAKVIEVRIG